MPDNRKKLQVCKPSLPDSRWITIAEACLYVRCSPQHIRRLIHAAELKAVRFSKGFLLDKSDLDNFLIRRKKFYGPYRRGTKPWVAKRHAENRGGAR